MNGEAVSSAWQLLKEAYQYQMGEDYDMAIELYQRSIDLHPTPKPTPFWVGPTIFRKGGRRDCRM